LKKDINAILLSAGYGKRLWPLTKNWPKCLMPIKGRPLLEYWLAYLFKSECSRVIVNTHYLSHIVESFLNQKRFRDKVVVKNEKLLLGTAGTVRNNYQEIKGKTLLLVHSDNWIVTDLDGFINYHFNRPKDTLMTMMVFDTSAPQTCGVVQTNSLGVVTGFFEKIENPPSSLANGAVYLIEPELIDAIYNDKNIKDFSLDVIPKYIGLIATWKNKGIHRDIGSLPELRRAQLDQSPDIPWHAADDWHEEFRNNPIHREVI